MSEYSIRGPHTLELAASSPRWLRFDVTSGGVVILVGHDPDTADLVYSGTGSARVRRFCDASRMFIVPDDKAGLVRIGVPELRQLEAGWSDEPSLTDLAPRPFGVVSPEIRAVMDQMNRNAIIREQAMLRAFQSRV